MLRVLLFIVLCISLCDCSYDYGRYSRKEWKELQKNVSEHQEMQTWYNKLVDREKNPIYIIETPVLNQFENRKGNFLDYRLIQLINGRSLNIDGYLTGWEDGRAPDGNGELDPYKPYIDQFFESLDQDSLKKILVEKSIEFDHDKLYILFPFNTDSLVDKPDLVNQNQKTKYERTLIKNTFYFPEGFNELVGSNKFNPNFSLEELPEDLIDTLSNRLEFLKSYLPVQYYKKVGKSELIIADPSESFEPQALWMKNEGGNIFMSSVLFRTILIDHLTFIGFDILDFTDNVSPPPYDRLLYFLKYDNIEKPRARTSAKTVESVSNFSKSVDLKIWKDIFFEKLYESLDFLLLHEMAHIYLGEGANESKCDCSAFQIIKAIKPNSDIDDLGVFYTYLIGQGQSQSAFWFSESRPDLFKELEIRLGKILKILNTGTTECI